MGQEIVGSRFASIDIGTNTVLLLIAKWVGGNLVVIKDEARIARLGEGLHRQPSFLPAAEDRVVRVLQEYRTLCDQHQVQQIDAVGTAAFRKAKNAPEFIERVRRETGIQIEVISGDEEARLSFLSAVKDFPQYANPVVVDIGGGSTEIITRQGAVSLELGSVVLTERYLRHDPPSPSEVKQMSKEIQTVIQNRACSTTSGSAQNDPILIGLAGTVTTLSAIRQRLPVWDGSKVQGSVLTKNDLVSMMNLFHQTTVEEKRKIAGMVAGREDTILAGSLILDEIMKTYHAEQAIVSDRGLRFGLLWDKLTLRSFGEIAP